MPPIVRRDVKKAPLICPVCNRPLDLIVDQYECVQVRERSCHVVDIRSLRAETEGTVCFVHPNHFDDLAWMVMMGTYPRP